MLLRKAEEVDLNELLKIVEKKIIDEVNGAIKGYISKNEIRALIKEKKSILIRISEKDGII